VFSEYLLNIRSHGNYIPNARFQISFTAHLVLEVFSHPPAPIRKSVGANSIHPSRVGVQAILNLCFVIVVSRANDDVHGNSFKTQKGEKDIKLLYIKYFFCNIYGKIIQYSIPELKHICY